METCDVLIVGAGVSGSVVALKAAREGLKTIVVEKKKQPGEANAKLDITRDAGIAEIVSELSLDIGDRSNVSRWFSPNDSFTLKSRIGDYFVKRGNAPDCFEVSTGLKAQDAGAEFVNEESSMR
jgi:flavin-dependent dehydrogenase